MWRARPSLASGTRAALSGRGDWNRDQRFVAPRRRASRSTPALALAVALAWSAAAPEAAAAAPPEHLYEVSVQAQPIFGAVERPGFLLSPVLSTDVLETSSMANLAGDRTAVASLVDPGPISDAAGLVGVIFPQVGTLPIPPFAFTLRSSGDRPSRERSLGPLTSSVRAESQLVLSQGRSKPFSVFDVLRVAGMQSESKVVLGDDGRVEGVGTTSLTGLDIAGLVQIDSVRSTTRAISTLQGSSSTTTTALEGVRALGFEAVIDRAGVRIVSPKGDPVARLTREQANERLRDLLSTRNVSLKLVEAGEQRAPGDGATRAASAGSALEISYDLIANFKSPSISLPGVGISLPVGDGIPTTFRFALGRTSGSALSGPVPPPGDDVDLGGGRTEGGGSSPDTPASRPISTVDPAAGLRGASRWVLVLGLVVAWAGLWQTRERVGRLAGLAEWVSRPREWET